MGILLLIVILLTLALPVYQLFKFFVEEDHYAREDHLFNVFISTIMVGVLGWGLALGVVPVDYNYYDADKLMTVQLEDGSIYSVGFYDDIERDRRFNLGESEKIMNGATIVFENGINSYGASNGDWYLVIKE